MEAHLVLPPERDHEDAEVREVRRFFAIARERGLNVNESEKGKRDGLRHRWVRELTGGETDQINRLTFRALRLLVDTLREYRPLPPPDPAKVALIDGDLDPRFYGSPPRT